MTEAELRELEAQAHREPPYPSSLFPPSVYYRFFRLLAARTKPRLSIVLGVCGGGDALHLALGWSQGKVIGIDHAWDHPDQIGYIRAVCLNYEHMIADSILSASQVGERHGKVDILFIDTIHTLDRTLDEFFAWQPYLAAGAVVCLDDLFRPGMQEAWDAMPEPKVRLDSLHDGAEFGGGFGVVY